MDEGWPFSDPENLAVITQRRIVREGAPILLVAHDEDDGGWQFLGLDEKDVGEGDAIVVALRTIVRTDPSVRELADLPLGWRAWRMSVSEPWQRVGE